MYPTLPSFPQLGAESATRQRRVFISYHHLADQAWYNAFSVRFHDQYETIWDNSLERRIDSDNVDYVIQRIRDNFIHGTSCTIVLCGAETWKRKYVDWEIKATLDKQHGLIGVQLPTLLPGLADTVQVPDRLNDNIHSGFAMWVNWAWFTASIQNVKSTIEQAVAKPASLIVNNRQMMGQNLS